jgi:hypothetical protein
MLLCAAPASATTFCVSDPACVTAGGTASADLGAALSAANANAGPDRVEVGVGTFDEATASGSGFLYINASNDPLELVGEGPGQTILKDSATMPGFFEPILAVRGPSTTVSGFTFEMSIDSERGLQFEQGASASNVEARIGVGTPANTTGFVLTGTGAETLSNASTDLAAGDASLGVNLIGAPGGTIQDVQISAESGIFVGVTDASAENVIRRARIIAADGNGVTASRGSSTLESSLVQVLSSGDIGLSVSNSNDITEAFDLEARNTTLIGPGSGISATGAGVFADNPDPGVQLPSLLLRDSILFGFTRPLECSQASATDDVPTLTTDYSNYPATGSSISPNCADTFTNTSNVDPAFVNPASDFHLMISPLVDAGTPGALGGGESTTDLDGNPRLVDGDGDGTARRDLGAYERAGVTPPDGGGASPLPRLFSADLVLRALKKKGRLAGALSSDNPGCLLGRLIEFFRVRKGPDPRVGTALAGSDGRFKLGRRPGPGRYYAEADALSLPGGDSCAGDRSGKAKLKRR